MAMMAATHAVAAAMKDWATEKGATHYAHVFYPLTGITAEKHDSFLEPGGGAVLPYPGGHAALVEFPTRVFPTRVAHRFFDLMRRRIRPVIAHPERYEPVWADATVLDPLLDGGAVLLLDVAALAGKYGRAPKKAAEQLLEAGYYQAACSDAHGVKDVKEVEEGIKRLFDQAGTEEASFLLVDGPKEILEGTIES